jgi:gamma-glutamyltranspeptidase/glutathione hydrolase
MLRVHQLKKSFIFLSFGAIFLILQSCSLGLSPQNIKSSPDTLSIAPLFPGHTRSQHEFSASTFAVASQGQATSLAALEIKKAGGNVIDAAIAASLAISVERPHSTGIGGGGFLLFWESQKQQVHTYDFRERAPLKTYANFYQERGGHPTLSLDGPLAVATPGLIHGLWELHQKHGKLPWKKLFTPAIRLAAEGFRVYPHLHEAIQARASVLKNDPEAKNLFFTQKGDALPVGTLLKQPQLAQTLREISATGIRSFYHGALAKKIVSSVQKAGGVLTLSDLENYETKKRQAVEGSYQGYRVLSMPPPSSGGAHVIQLLNLWEPQNLKQWGPQHHKTLHQLAQGMQIAFADRAKYMGDADYAEIPIKKIISKNYARKLHSYFTESISPPSSFPREDLLKESTETTHFSLADGDDVVVSTQTINGWFGSGMMAANTGIILNNEMDDFAQSVGASNLFGAIGGEKNLVAPLKRPLSSMSPTIVLKDGKPFLALGTPSGTRIITCVALTIMNVLEFQLDLYDAVAATRIHQQWSPHKLRIEAPSFPEKTLAELKKKGHDIEPFNIGCQIQALQKKDQGWLSVSDPRGEGLASGF